ncbi:MAG: hypothetical protein R3B57_07420 [Phycisphaerales bacterium]
MTRPDPRRLTTRVLLAALALSTLGALGGCIVGAAIGGMAESYRRTGKHKVEAEYQGLRGKSYAVVVTADRLVQAQNPGLIGRVTTVVNDRLAHPDNNVGASAYIPSQDLLNVLYETPQWPAMARGEVAKLLGVQRLIVIELTEYHLHEPGNQYVWEGAAAGSVSVYESDSGLPDDPIYDKAIRVTFPDGTGYMSTEMSQATVTSELSRRFINRCAWLFYDHEEENVIPY